jgi:hypothetical protein
MRVAAVGPVETVAAARAIEDASISLLLPTFSFGIVHLFTTP